MRHEAPADRPRRRPRLAMRGVALLALGLTLLACTGCGDTLQDKPIPHNILEGMIAAPFPVYWLGESFGKLRITEATHDASGAYSVQYGNCLQGGQGTCTPPLRIVTSPDNSFVPGGDTPIEAMHLRGVTVVLTDAGRTIAIPTGGVVVDVLASDSTTALEAARAIAPVNRPDGPGQTLPARLPDTGYGSTPLPSQLPATVAPLG